ncbi:hypothetical protein [Qipengyuania flava]|uniref:hypothetical protein n=1 Tax=Qipengyuania flava TaxID=192812 RepID=UPI00102E8061|nr:hypothetical protein [Qipengyuania flava]
MTALLPAAALAQSVNDFSLEPAPTPSATPQAQGPADTRSGIEIRPRAVNTPAPTPSTANTPTPTPTPTADSPRSEPRSAQPEPRPVPSPTVTPRTIETAPVSPPVPSPTPSQAQPSDTLVPSVAQPNSAVPSSDAAGPGSDESADATVRWPWLAGAAALLALLGAGLLLWRRRRSVVVPEIERPVVAGAGPAEALPLSEAVQIRMENEKLIRSAAYATLKYSVTLINRTDAALTELALGLDLVSAHAEAPMEDQVATLQSALEQRHDVARLSPRQSMTLTGQVQMPLATAHVIRQGRLPLLVPLLRLRIDRAESDAVVKTYVVGQGTPEGGRLQPFRLDEGPRSYAPIAQREIA